MDLDRLFIYVLVFIGGWAFSKSPIVAGGITAVLWSVLSFFSDTAEENRAARKRMDDFTESRDLFRNGNDEEYDFNN
jgi:hypothetical protein